MLVVVLAVLVVVALGFAVAAFRSRSRLARAGGFECALRPAPVGTGQGGRWRHVRAVATRGHLDVRAIGPGGFWLPPRRMPAVEVLEVRRDPGRRTGWRTVWSIGPHLHVLALTTPAGDVEVAVDGRDVERLLALLDGVPGEGRPSPG